MSWIWLFDRRLLLTRVVDFAILNSDLGKFFIKIENLRRSAMMVRARPRRRRRRRCVCIFHVVVAFCFWFSLFSFFFSLCCVCAFCIFSILTKHVRAYFFFFLLSSCRNTRASSKIYICVHISTWLFPAKAGNKKRVKYSNKAMLWKLKF